MMFSFSGHGVQLNGQNFLISGMAVKRLLLLDARRTNPLWKGWIRALNRGLASMAAPSGALIAYATSPGKPAPVGSNRADKSPYVVYDTAGSVMAGTGGCAAMRSNRCTVR
jgi:hypothetical protein